jgi:hypothetical protein
MRIGVLVLLLAALASCGGDPGLNGRAGASFAVPADFVFVRDTARLFPPGQVRQAEDDLRFQAERSGVFGVVITVEEANDESALAEPVIADVEALGGAAMVAVCTPGDCDLTVPTAFSDVVAGDLDGVAAGPEPAPGQGNPTNPRNELPRWRELVGTIATLVAEREDR